MEKSNKPKLPKGKKPAFVDEEVKGRIINAIRLGLTVEDACTFAGVSRTTYYNWVELGENDPKYAAFLDELKKAIVERKVRLLQNIEKHSELNWVPSAWRLERMFPQEFGRKDRLDVKHLDPSEDTKTAYEEFIRGKKENS
jgi:nitrogen regulatory protein PII-like uncharacterized protein